MEVASINPAIAIVTNAPIENLESTGRQGWIVTLARDEPIFLAAFNSFAIRAPSGQIGGWRQLRPSQSHVPRSEITTAQAGRLSQRLSIGRPASTCGGSRRSTCGVSHTWYATFLSRGTLFVARRSRSHLESIRLVLTLWACPGEIPSSSLVRRADQRE